MEDTFWVLLKSNVDNESGSNDNNNNNDSRIFN